MKKKSAISIEAKSFLSSLAIVFALMVFTYVLTFLVPAGEYAHNEVNGHSVINIEGGYRQIEGGGIPFWKWLLSPFLVLGASGSATLIAVIAFLLIIGGIFNALNQCNFIEYMLAKLNAAYGETRYKLLGAIVLMFMLMGSFLGSFEEVVPMVPVLTALAVSLGWDALTGVSISLIAAGFGFTAGVMNPYTIGVAQKLADLPMFSGVWMRGLNFILLYALLMFFILRRARKIEGPVEANTQQHSANLQMDRALKVFAAILLTGVLLIIASAFVTVLQDYTMIIIALTFLIAGCTACFISGFHGKSFFAAFKDGVIGILPTVLLILMASSISYTLTESKIIDTILHAAVLTAQRLPRALVLLFIYLITLILEFFVPSGSAKAFILIPLIVPIAQSVGISAQLCIIAYAFGDGFSNVFYPTNPALIISLSFANLNYGEYASQTRALQLTTLLVTSLLLLFALAVGYC